MASSLSDEEVQKILDAWEQADSPSYNQIAQRVGYNKDTVKKYVEKHFEGEADMDEDAGKIPSIENEAEREPSLFPDRGERVADDFTEFFKKLNDEYGFGIKEKAIRMMAGEIRNTGTLPGPDDVVGFLESADSGISNTRELSWIGRQYSLWVNQYKQNRVGFDDMGGQFGGSGGMMSAPGQSGFGQGSPGMSGSGMGAPGMGGPGGQPGGGGGMGGMNPMMMMFQQMNQQMKELREELHERESNESERLLEKKTREYLEKNLERLIEGEPDTADQEVIQELRALRQEMQEGRGAPAPGEGGNWQDMVLGLVQSGTLNPGDAVDLVERLKGEDEPVEVLEKKYEKQIKELELDHQKKRVERLGDTAERLVDRFGESLGAALVSGGEEAETDGAEEQASSEQMGGQPAGGNGAMTAGRGDTVDPAPAEADGDHGACEHCGEDLLSEGNQVACPNCEWGIGPCDICGHPVEIPPKGEEPFGKCPDCEEHIEIGEDDDAEVECDGCEWSGPAADLRGAFLQCGNCRNYRPIMRTEDVAQQVEAMGDIMGD